MKKCFSLLMFALLIGSTLNATTIKQNLKINKEVKLVTCEEACSLVIDSFEEDYGCMDADDYNELYLTLTNHYCN